MCSFTATVQSPAALGRSRVIPVLRLQASLASSRAVGEAGGPGLAHAPCCQAPVRACASLEGELQRRYNEKDCYHPCWLLVWVGVTTRICRAPTLLAIWRESTSRQCSHI